MCPASILSSSNTSSIVLWAPPHPYSHPIGLVELTAPQATRMVHDPCLDDENATRFFSKIVGKERFSFCQGS